MSGLDYANIMRAGQSLVPDLRQQTMQREAFDMQREQFAVQRQALEQKATQQQREIQRQTSFQSDLEQVLAGGGDARSIQGLMLRYPEMAEGIKPAWEAMDERQRQTDLTHTGTMYARAQAGDIDGAIAVLEERVNAERKAGSADPQDEAILAGLRSPNPVEQRAAVATIGIQLAALTGDKFTEMYGKLNQDSEPTQIEKLANYFDRIGQHERAEAVRANAAAPDLVAVEAGGSLYNKNDFAPPANQQSRGGDPASRGGGVPAPQLGANGLPAALTPEQYQVVVDRMGKERTDAWMQSEGIAMTAGAPVRVRSVQEARKLPSGSMFITPDGRTMRVP